VRPIYKSYPVYAPGHEPPRFMEWLKQQKPVVIWDDKGHAPPLKTEADWIRAGGIVFDAPIGWDASEVSMMRDPETYKKTGTPVANDGTMPFQRYVIRKKGQVEVGDDACATCHTRVMLNGNHQRSAGEQSLRPV
jgi:hypothetical protein